MITWSSRNTKIINILSYFLDTVVKPRYDT
nr:palindromic element RPE4 domain-containing protein [Rickettsia canadensis]